jgi:hypothetical protein
MKARLLISALLLASMLPQAANALVADPSRIDAYVTPYYNSAGPVIKVGAYNAGLASNDDKRFVATIRSMKKRWTNLTFCQMYVGSIRLYDLGYRQESVYWFYSAQYRGRQFALLLDQSKMGRIGDPGFELFHAQDAFMTLAGPYVNGYAFGDLDSLTKIVRRVQRENGSVVDLPTIYPGVTFAPKATWRAQNAQLNAGLSQLLSMLATQKDQLKQQRVQSGTEAQFSHLSSKPL